MARQFAILAIAIVLATAASANELKLTETDNLIKITLGDKPVLEYVKTAKPVPEGIEKHFSRSGYIHPVYNPAGQEFTGDFPPDHAHQHALFFAWTKASYNKKKVDFWNQAKKLGSVEHRGVAGLEREDDRVSFSVKHAFIAGSGPKAKDVLMETWKVTVHKTNGDYFLFDVESVQECIADKPLTLEKYHYGGMAMRLNGAWVKEKNDDSVNAGDLQYLTNEGKDRWDGNHSKPDWVAMHGKLDGQDTSAAVFCHPDNFRAPQPVRIHPNKPYFCFAPSVEGKFQIKPGETYVSKYRYLVTSKALDKALIEKHWQAYQNTK